jgi:hypothetical protein
MHYHLVLIDTEGEHPYGRIFPTQEEAERQLPGVMHLITDAVWEPKRYPGRSARRREVAVYLDRHHRGGLRHEVVVLRCPSPGADVDPSCYLWGRGPRHEHDAPAH